MPTPSVFRIIPRPFHVFKVVAFSNPKTFSVIFAKLRSCRILLALEAFGLTTMKSAGGGQRRAKRTFVRTGRGSTLTFNFTTSYLAPCLATFRCLVLAVRHIRAWLLHKTQQRPQFHRSNSTTRPLLHNDSRAVGCSRDRSRSDCRGGSYVNDSLKADDALVVIFFFFVVIVVVVLVRGKGRCGRNGSRRLLFSREQHRAFGDISSGDFLSST